MHKPNMRVEMALETTNFSLFSVVQIDNIRLRGTSLGNRNSSKEMINDFHCGIA